MPVMDGHTLVRMARRELGDVKVILISGYADEGTNGNYDPNAAVHFLPKPFSLADLAGKVKLVMAG
jgi:two-component system cell cycle sensor histidine kinase/response regulator CckA